MSNNDKTLLSTLLRSLEGIISDTNADVDVAQQAKRELLDLNVQSSDLEALPLQGWLDIVSSETNDQDAVVRNAIRLAITITYLREKCQTRATDSITAIKESEYSLLESVLNDALTSNLFKPHYTGRSHQGFLSVPLCRHTRPNGDNDELWRLHVWLPGSPTPDPTLAIHSHQSFAQSWILAGENTNTLWSVEPTSDVRVATHSIYKLAERYSKVLEPGSAEAKEGSLIVNTGQNLVVKEQSREHYHRNQSYVVQADHYHTTGVPHRTVVVTLFFFDASRGFIKDAGVALGPADGTEFKQYRNPQGIPPDVLANVVRAVRAWEIQISQALSSANQGKWIEAANKFLQTKSSFNHYLEGERERKHRTIEDFEGLHRYKEVAQSLCSWTEHMAKGEELKHTNQDESAKQFRCAVSVCEPIANFPMVGQCSLMAWTGLLTQSTLSENNGD